MNRRGFLKRTGAAIVGGLGAIFLTKEAATEVRWRGVLQGGFVNTPTKRAMTSTNPQIDAYFNREYNRRVRAGFEKKWQELADVMLPVSEPPERKWFDLG